MGLFGNKRDKTEKVDKYEYHSSSKAGRAGGYGPPALLGAPPSPYFPSPMRQNYIDGFAEFPPGTKAMKNGKTSGPSRSLYGLTDPMQQAMLLPPQSQAAMQAQAAAMLQMQQYMQGQAPGTQFAGILPPIQMPLAAAQQAGLVPPQMQPYYTCGPQQTPALTPFMDPNMPQQQPQMQGAFAPYQQPNMYDPAAAGFYAGPYGYVQAAF